MIVAIVQSCSHFNKFTKFTMIHKCFTNVKVLPQLWKLAQNRDLNSGPFDLESSALPPRLRIPLTIIGYICY